MEKYTLQNNFLSITINQKGAELSSVIKENTEYIWQADPAAWGRHAPLLFPIVGSVKDKKYQYRGIEYSLSQHGFARDTDFELVSHQHNELILKLVHSEASLNVYPFKFELIATFTLSDNQLLLQYEVKNVGEDELYFQIGGHPGFKVPLFENEVFEDYVLNFENDEVLISNSVNLSNGLLSHQTKEIQLINHQLPISTSLFDEDALVLKSIQSKEIFLLNANGKGVKLHLGNMPWLGIWSKKDCKQFVCLEPWQGHADFEDTNSDFTTKAGIVKLTESERYTSGYSLEFL